MASSHEQRKNPQPRCLVTLFLPAFLPVDVPAGIILFELFSICQGIILMIVTKLLLLSIWFLKLITILVTVVWLKYFCSGSLMGHTAKQPGTYGAVGLNHAAAYTKSSKD